MTRSRWLHAIFCLVFLALLQTSVQACPSCQDNKCVPFLGCACIPRIGCVVPIPIPWTAPPGQIPTGVPNVSIPSPVQIPAVAPVAANAAEKAVQDLIKNLTKAGSDTTATVAKAVEDTKAEAGRAGKQVEEAGKAIARYVQNEIKSEQGAITNATRRVREGKFVDAFWHLGTERYQAESDNAASAAQESDLIRTVGATAASAYGGPAGAAAYAAWLTFKQTGDANLALRAGILTGASSLAFSSVNGMASDTSLDLAKKTVVTGAIGGLAVAAAGGNEEAIKAGFLTSGAMVLVQDGYRNYTGHPLDGRSSEGEAYCMSTDPSCGPPDSAMLQIDKDGNATLDMSKVDPRVPAVGLKVDPSKVSWQSEQSNFMTSVSRVPGMQAMAVFHDTWTMSWQNDLLVKASILPAVVMTYTGTGAPYYDLLRKTTIDSAVEKKFKVKSAGVVAGMNFPGPGDDDSDKPLQSKDSSTLKASALPSNSLVVTTSYICAAGLDSRSLFVEAGKREQDATICRVNYQRPEGQVEVAQSKISVRSCQDKLSKIVATSVRVGWSCSEGSAAWQASKAQRISHSQEKADVK